MSGRASLFVFQQQILQKCGYSFKMTVTHILFVIIIVKRPGMHKATIYTVP